MATKTTTTKKKTVKVEKPAAAEIELAAEAGVQEMVAGAEAVDVARGMARQAAGNLAAGASDLTPPRMLCLWRSAYPT